MRTDPERFILDNTGIMHPPHVPELRLHLATEAHELWLKTEEELEEIGLPPPFWAFAWAGGQGLARYILDHPESVSGKRVLDFASGSGLVAIAAAKAGAAAVVAADIDPWTETAIRLNAALNGVAIDFTGRNLVGTPVEADVLLAGDVFYDRAFADLLVPWFLELADRGVTVLIGDPGRAYLPKQRLYAEATYQVSVTRALEDSEVKKTTVWRFV
ncbi:methyltransferase [Agrobacterium tumefaciens]|uniref:class I SAM-dependent methyltransferase n=1 Tax=Agrobacterium tumefaciens TaxID=358 RepID=UPI001574DFE4|nr:methyltransferase [Agrobacterium tumefaciens]NSZ63986.1 methyltransferase [Agrobacterium tumefaciens]NTA70356.1 methyltransferase [Agrobacterium tumefaciens]WIE37473.1 methyltransferase [Agrobacterium tumefaciens]